METRVFNKLKEILKETRGLVISLKHNTVFIHNAKAGGSSISHVLRSYGYDDKIITKNCDLDSKRVNDYLMQIAKNWENMLKFTSVRNPYEKVLSLYNFNNNGGSLYHKTKDLDAFLEKEEMFKVYGDLRQSEFIYFEDGSPFLDLEYIIRLENFEEDFSKVLEKLNLETSLSKTRKNITNYSTNKNIDILTEKQKEIIQKFLKRDFELLNYSIA